MNVLLIGWELQLVQQNQGNIEQMYKDGKVPEKEMQSFRK